MSSYFKKYSPTKKQWKAAGRIAYKKTGLVNPIKKGKISSTRLIKDVQMMKALLNVEKKRVVNYSTSGASLIGQVNGNSSGHYLVDVTPLPPQGTGYNQRTGNSIKWCSSHYDIQLVQQSNTNSPLKIKYYFVKVLGTPYSGMSAVVPQFINFNPFVTGGTVYDYNSARNPDYFKDFKVVKSGTIYMAPDPQSATTMIKTLKLGFKLDNHHVRWSVDNSTLSQGQIFLLMVADNGNINASTVSTLGGIPNTNSQTGVIFNYIRTDYFVDN